MSAASIFNLSPVRIYILWHPALDAAAEAAKDKSAGTGAENKPVLQENRGLKLARRLYHWFRLENMEGIPVYFRSVPAQGSSLPPPIPEDCGIRNYIIPLIDANMVASPEWRRYVGEFVSRSNPASTAKATGNDQEVNAAPPPPEFMLLPVAMEPLAYNMPESMRRLNFIRHISQASQLADDEALIARLTEVICRDLRARIFRTRAGDGGQPQTPPNKIKIFLSHAKADDTKEAIALKEYIQRETQCEAFFDETDIASGYDYARILQESITQDSAGLIVIQGDNYADRPWCRKEIRDFLRPFCDQGALKNGRLQYFTHPAIVVQTMQGQQIARTIPELGYSPCIRWPSKTPEDSSSTPRFVVTSLLREILFSLFHRLLADRIAEREGNRREIFINRSPDPFLINRILSDEVIESLPESERPCSFVHPGYGLSGMDREGLKTAFPKCEFTSFLARSAASPLSRLNLNGKIIAISAGNPGDILAKGLWDEHLRELLIRLLRPLLHAQASILYGGKLPDTLRHPSLWEGDINFTVTLLQILAGERKPSVGHDEQPRLYIPTPCFKLPVAANVIAQWTDICSFVPVSAEDSGIELKALREKAPQAVSSQEPLEATSAARRRAQKQYERMKREYEIRLSAIHARAYSAMRRKICDTHKPLICELPDSLPQHPTTKSVETLAHILIGGKLLHFTGIMPGIFEEFLHAVEARKSVYLISEYGGAAALLSGWLLQRPGKRPPELTVEYYKTHSKGYKEVLAEFGKLPATTPHLLTPQDAFDRLWSHLKAGAQSISLLLNNGLDEESNRILLASSSSGAICDAVSKGVTCISSSVPPTGPKSSKVTRSRKAAGRTPRQAS